MPETKTDPKADSPSPAKTETKTEEKPEPLALISRVEGFNPHLGQLEVRKEVTTDIDGKPLTDAEKRRLANDSQFLYIRGEADH